MRAEEASRIFADIILGVNLCKRNSARAMKLIGTRQMLPARESASPDQTDQAGKIGTLCELLSPIYSPGAW
jgi:hypothetical protein